MKTGKCSVCSRRRVLGIDDRCKDCRTEVRDEFRECADCIYKKTSTPNPCNSCEQDPPTNYTEFT